MNFKINWADLVAPCRSDSFQHAYTAPLCSALLSFWEDHIPTIHMVTLKVFSFLPKYAVKADWENHLFKQKGFMTLEKIYTLRYPFTQTLRVFIFFLPAFALTHVRCPPPLHPNEYQTLQQKKEFLIWCLESPWILSWGP